MSCVCIMTPLVIAAWPAFSSAVVAAATSLGYQVASEALEEKRASNRARNRESQVTLEIPQSEIVTGQLGRDQRLTVTRNGVTVAFSRDVRGRASVCVNGTGQSDAVLRELGEQLSQRVVQQYVYQRLMEEMQQRQFVVVEEETDTHHAIRLKVRHWET